MTKLPQVIVRHPVDEIRKEMKEIATPPFVTDADGFHVTDAKGRTMGWWVIYDAKTIPVGPTGGNLNDTILLEGTIVPEYCLHKGIVESGPTEWIDTSKLQPPVPPPSPPPVISIPTVTSLTPAYAKMGDPDLTLRVIGTNFLTTSKIVFNGGEETTTFISATEVRTTVKPSTASVAGTYPVLVRNVGVSDSNSMGFTFYAASAAMTLSTIAPTTGARNTTLTITATGDGFYPDDKMLVDAVAYPLTTFTSGQSVKASVGTGATARTANVKLQRADASRSTSSKNFTVT